MPVSLRPDKNVLKQKFYTLSRKYHPDFYSSTSEVEKADALEISSEVNKAYKVFQNGDETIKYVLQQKGLLEEEEKYELPPAFLMDMLDLSEEMMEAKTENDEEAKSSVRQRIDNVQNEIYDPVQTIVENYQEGVTTQEELLQVKDYYYKKKYLNRILAGMAWVRNIAALSK